MDWVFQQQCHIKRNLGADCWSKPVYADPVSSPCRWQAKQQLIRTKNGKEVMSQAEVWLPPGTGIDADDVLVYGGADHIVLSVGELVDLAGNAAFKKAWC
ncbi:MAG: hypothetical protein ACOY9Y_09740 [Bacillota bacterium]